MNETLMALLFKLDSVLGVDSSVRDCRKAVIKKAIALQERVDDIVAGNQEASTVETTEKSDVLAEAADQTPKMKNSIESRVDSINQSLEIEGKSFGVEDQADVSTNCDQQIEVTVDVDSSGVADSGNGVEQFLSQEVGAPAVYDAVDVINDHNRSENLAVCCPDASAPVSTELEAMSETKDDGLVESAPEICENKDFNEVGVDSEVKVDNETWVVKHTVEDKNVTLPVNECIEGSLETTPTEYSANPMNFIEVGDEHTSLSQDDGLKAERAECTEGSLKDCEVARGKEDDKRSSELLERMMEDNEKMMSMMTQLFERNEMQTRMLSSLTQRVEQLEKAFICDWLRRKKKRNAVGTEDDSESSPDQKKCGKR